MAYLMEVATFYIKQIDRKGGLMLSVIFTILFYIFG